MAHSVNDTSHTLIESAANTQPVQISTMQKMKKKIDVNTLMAAFIRTGKYW